jgi:YidC/Oxa1 family membrane protein insertase
VHHLDQLVPSFLSKLDSGVLFLTMPDLGRMHVPRPPKSCTLVYAFHSLNSIQAAYRHRAFDNYDVFFSCGRHHDRELAAHFPLYGLPTPTIHPVGYWKLDRIARDHARHVRRFPDRSTVLVAPSWGQGNVLEGHGVEVTGRLLEAGYRVVVRPHPCFFQPIYPKGNRIVEELQERFGSHPGFVLEGRFTDEESFHEAAVMISDWSGASFEYALGTARPVLFLDVPRKVFNPEWERLGTTPFEEAMRSVVGEVLAPSEMGKIAGRVASLIERAHEWKARIEESRSRDIHHFGGSARAGAAILNDLLEKGKGAR